MTPMNVTKQLSANDTGETGGHQAGILVPKRQELLSFFPKLDSSKYNPRSHIIFTDESGIKWEFAFIYYNNALFGGTRNEYRLTRMTKYIREAALVTGDELHLSRDENGDYFVAFHRKMEARLGEKNVLTLGSGWRIINI